MRKGRGQVDKQARVLYTDRPPQRTAARAHTVQRGHRKLICGTHRRRRDGFPKRGAVIASLVPGAVDQLPSIGLEPGARSANVLIHGNYASP